MKNEEFQKIVLTQLADIKTDVSHLKTDVAVLKTDVAGLKTDVAGLKTDVANIKGQLDENTSILRALEHRSQVQAAETEGMKLATVSKTAFERVEAKIDRMMEIQTIQGESINILALRQLQTEAELASFKKAQGL